MQGWSQRSRSLRTGKPISRDRALTYGKTLSGPSISVQSWSTPGLAVTSAMTVEPGAMGALQTLREMKKLARAGSTSPLIRREALELVGKGFGGPRGLPQKDFAGESRRLFSFVQTQIRYVMDPDGTEFLHPADWVLMIGQGDCDDKSILLAALLLSIGHTPRFKAVAFEQDLYSHVWVQDAWPGSAWVDLETTEPLPWGKAIPLDAAVSTMTLDLSP